jgi:hypothetical protein
MSSGTPPVSPSTSTASVTSVTPTTLPATTSVSPVAEGEFRVGWIGGSEVVLRDVSLAEHANSLGATVDGRRVLFEAYTRTAPSPADTSAAVADAAAQGVDALVVTINPQWLYGRVCEGVTPPHTRYACLLEITEVTGGAQIESLGEQIVATALPALLVLMPTSVDALEDPALSEPIAVANDRLEELLPRGPSIEIIDERLTAEREEFREGVGFYDMVHTTPTGAKQLAGAVAGELFRVLQD